MEQCRRIRLARKRAVATEDGVRRKVTRQVEPVENAPRRCDRLVGEDGERGAATESVEDLGDTLVGTRVIEEPRVVQRQIALERVGWAWDAAGPNARATSCAAPPPTIAPISASEIGATPQEISSALAASVMSRSESTRVPSRSKTMSFRVTGLTRRGTPRTKSAFPRR